MIVFLVIIKNKMTEKETGGVIQLEYTELNGNQVENQAQTEGAQWDERLPYITLWCKLDKLGLPELIY